MKISKTATRNLERKLNDLAKDAKDYTGGVFNNPYRSYAQGIAYALAEVGCMVDWKDGTAHVVEIK